METPDLPGTRARRETKDTSDLLDLPVEGDRVGYLNCPRYIQSTFNKDLYRSGFHSGNE